MDLRPIFVSGCDRSGTTMLGDMLGASAQSFATPESQWVHQFGRRLYLRPFSNPAAAVHWLRQQFRFAVWAIDTPDAELAALIDLEDLAGSITRLVRHYVDTKLPAKSSATRWIDHTPDNFKHYPVLRALFPQARFVHIVRDGRAVFQSIKQLDWGPNNAYAATRHWAARLDEAVAVEMAEKSHCLRVRYEDILQQPETELARICDFAELPYDDAMVNGGGLILPDFTRGQHQLVGRRPDPSRGQAWRQRLSQREIAVFEAYPPARAYMRAFGYAPDTETPAHIGSLSALFYYAHDFLLYLRNRARHIRMETKQIAGQT